MKKVISILVLSILVMSLAACGTPEKEVATSLEPIIIEKEVIKEIEVPVEKIVYVEKPVEKIVAKVVEVPVKVEKTVEVEKIVYVEAEPKQEVAEVIVTPAQPVVIATAEPKSEPEVEVFTQPIVESIPEAPVVETMPVNTTPIFAGSDYMNFGSHEAWWYHNKDNSANCIAELESKGYSCSAVTSADTPADFTMRGTRVEKADNYYIVEIITDTGILAYTYEM